MCHEMTLKFNKSLPSVGVGSLEDDDDNLGSRTRTLQTAIVFRNKVRRLSEIKKQSSEAASAELTFSTLLMVGSWKSAAGGA